MKRFTVRLLVYLFAAAEFVPAFPAALPSIQVETDLVTVGLVPWSLDRSGLTSGFIPEKIADELDFIAVHIYPEKGKLGEAMDTLNGFDVGKPVVIEELFPLRCSADELGEFIEKSRGIASGWVGFYWGKTPDEYRDSTTIGDRMTLDWLELFEKMRPQKRVSSP